MTLLVDDLKQYQTQKFWRKCAIYLQKTATWQRSNVNKTFMQSLCPSGHTSQVNSHDRMPTKIFWKWLMVNQTAFCLAVWIEIKRLQIWRSEERDGRIEYGHWTGVLQVLTTIHMNNGISTFIPLGTVIGKMINKHIALCIYIVITF
jgi:hypothetical protein